MIDTAAVMAFLVTTDSARARAFYETTLGLAFVVDEPYALVFNLKGAMLRISPIPQFSPAPYTVLGWQVDDIVFQVRELVSRGVVFETFPHVAHDEDGITTFPDGAKVAWFKDPDGNILSVTQF